MVSLALITPADPILFCCRAPDLIARDIAQIQTAIASKLWVWTQLHCTHAA